MRALPPAKPRHVTARVSQSFKSETVQREWLEWSQRLGLTSSTSIAISAHARTGPCHVSTEIVGCLARDLRGADVRREAGKGEASGIPIRHSKRTKPERLSPDAMHSFLGPNEKGTPLMLLRAAYGMQAHAVGIRTHEMGSLDCLLSTL